MKMGFLKVSYLQGAQSHCSPSFPKRIWLPAQQKIQGLFYRKLLPSTVLKKTNTLPLGTLAFSSQNDYLYSLCPPPRPCNPLLPELPIQFLVPLERNGSSDIWGEISKYEKERERERNKQRQQTDW